MSDSRGWREAPSVVYCEPCAKTNARQLPSARIRFATASRLSPGKQHALTETRSCTGLVPLLDLKPEPVAEPEFSLKDIGIGGITIAGRLIEIASGESYADYLKRHIFEPLGMRADEGEAHPATLGAGPVQLEFDDVAVVADVRGLGLLERRRVPGHADEQEQHDDGREQSPPAAKPLRYHDTCLRNSLQPRSSPKIGRAHV